MAELTENVGLTKPAGTEKYSLDVVNGNTDILDQTLGALLDAVGTGTGTGLTDKIGENTDTATGTVFGDLHIIKEQTEQNGTDIAEVKEVVDSNAEKLNALQTSANNTKAVVDLINTQTESVKQTGEQTAGKVDTIGTNTAETALQVAKIGNSTDTGNATLFGLLNQLKEQLATANQNIATLLVQTKGVKAIVAGNVQVKDGDAAGTAIVNIPDTMNPERVVVITTSKSSALGDNVTWSRSGRTVTFSATNYYTSITYQFIEFY